MNVRDEAGRILAEAAEWQAKLASDDIDWEAFSSWLEADEKRRDAYERIAMLDREIDDAAGDIRSKLPSNDELVAPAGASYPSPRRWGRFAVALVVSAAVTAIALTMRPPSSVSYEIVTGRRHGRVVTLEDGSRVVIDKNSRLSFQSGEDGAVTIAYGTANFAIRHNPARNFAVLSGPFKITDIGTHFDVSRHGDHLTISVSDGAVAVLRDEGDRKLVEAGRRVDFDTGGHSAVLSDINANSVGAWENGRLLYDGSPLTLVAADIARYSNEKIIVSPDAEHIRFSGVLVIGDGSRLVSQLQQFLPIEARDSKGVIVLERSRGA